MSHLPAGILADFEKLDNLLPPGAARTPSKLSSKKHRSKASGQEPRASGGLAVDATAHQAHGQYDPSEDARHKLSSIREVSSNLHLENEEHASKADRANSDDVAKSKAQRRAHSEAVSLEEAFLKRRSPAVGLRSTEVPSTHDRHTSESSRDAAAALQLIMEVDEQVGGSMPTGANFSGRLPPLELEDFPASPSTLVNSLALQHAPTAAQAQASRKEVIALRDRLHTMMGNLNASNINHEYPAEIRTLLKVVEEEQIIYDAVFSDIIKQVTTHMVERGELLSEIRKRYANLFVQIPRVVKNVYADLLSHRAINKRLVAELVRAQSSMKDLSKHLDAVRQADIPVAQQGESTKDKLLAILARTENADSTLAEYHRIYQLQRERLESRMKHIENEKKVWVDAATNLALRMGKEHGLPDVTMLQKFEYGRVRAVNHFNSLLSERDRREALNVEAKINAWITELVRLGRHIEKEDGKCLNAFSRTVRDMRALHDILGLDEMNIEETPTANSRKNGTAAAIKDAQTGAAAPSTTRPLTIGVSDSDISIHPADPELLPGFDQARQLGAHEVQILKAMLKKWLDQINIVSTRYTSDRDEHIITELKNLRNSLDQWITLGVTLLRKNEKTSSGKEYGALHKRLIRLKSELEGWIHRLRAKASGDDGTATHVISLQNQIEDKYTIFYSRDNSKPLNLSERMLLGESLAVWNESLSVLTGIISVKSTSAEHQMTERVDAWVSALLDQLSTDFSERNERNLQLHNSNVRWMVRLLLRSEQQASNGSWDKELDNLQAENDNIYNDLMKDACDMELLSDDRKDLREIIRYYCDAWFKTAKRLLEVEGKMGQGGPNQRYEKYFLENTPSAQVGSSVAEMESKQLLTEDSGVRLKRSPPSATLRRHQQVLKDEPVNAHEFTVLVGSTSGEYVPEVSNAPVQAEDRSLLEFDSHFVEQGRDGKGTYEDMVHISSKALIGSDTNLH